MRAVPTREAFLKELGPAPPSMVRCAAAVERAAGALHAWCRRSWDEPHSMALFCASRFWRTCATTRRRWASFSRSSMCTMPTASLTPCEAVALRWAERKVRGGPFIRRAELDFKRRRVARGARVEGEARRPPGAYTRRQGGAKRNVWKIRKRLQPLQASRSARLAAGSSPAPLASSASPEAAALLSCAAAASVLVVFALACVLRLLAACC